MHGEVEGAGAVTPENSRQERQDGQEEQPSARHEPTGQKSRRTVGGVVRPDLLFTVREHSKDRRDGCSGGLMPAASWAPPAARRGVSRCRMDRAGGRSRPHGPINSRQERQDSQEEPPSVRHEPTAEKSRRTVGGVVRLEQEPDHASHGSTTLLMRRLVPDDRLFFLAVLAFLA